MFSALKKLARSGDERCSAPVPMSSSLQKKFSRGVHFNMKILIKGDRNVGKSCLLQRLQGGPFIEEYAPTDQIQVAPINWAYKNSDYIVKVEVWEVVDKGRTKKKPPLGLKLENQAAPAAEEAYETPVLDATFLDVYKNASGVILMLDITKPWTFEYVVKELSSVPADLPVVVLGNHCDMQHHRQVHMHHIDQALHHARVTRTAPVRYAESSMRNGFGLRLLHKFLSVPFLRLQRTSLLEQLQRNQKDTEEIERELDDFQSSEESHYDTFVDRLASKRRQSSLAEPRAASERSPSIVLGAGKPIIPHGVNPLLAQSLNPTPKPPSTSSVETPQQIQFVSPELTRVKHTVSVEMTPPRMPQDSAPSTPSCANASGASGALDEFYAGTLDSSFLEDLAPVTHNQDYVYDSDSDEETTNPKVNVYQDDLDIEASPPARSATSSSSTFPDRHTNTAINPDIDEEDLNNMMGRSQISKDSISVNTELTQDETGSHISTLDSNHNLEMSLDNDFPLWAGDSSARRSPEGGEDPDFSREADEKVINKISEKKHKKKKSKDKDKGDYSASEKSDRKEKKNKHKKSKNEKRPSHPQQDLLAPTPAVEFNYEEYDSI